VVGEEFFPGLGPVWARATELCARALVDDLPKTNCSLRRLAASLKSHQPNVCYFIFQDHLRGLFDYEAYELFCRDDR
jgi:hypothetical protein